VLVILRSNRLLKHVIEGKIEERINLTERPGRRRKQILDNLKQRFSNFFQVGTTFISQNVQRTTLLLSPLKANLSFF
jgi:hypothetical protein